jgi:hypothetical protein
MAKRTALLYSGSLLSGAFSGLIAAGITKNLDGARGLRAWRWLFIIGQCNAPYPLSHLIFTHTPSEGAITVAIAFFAFWVLPNLPRTTSWLSEDEKVLAAWRLEEDIGEDDWVDSKDQSAFHGAKLAVK